MLNEHCWHDSSRLQKDLYVAEFQCQRKDKSKGWGDFVDSLKTKAVTHKNAYPLPHIDDMLQVLSGSQWFGTIDLLSEYWQMGVAERDKEKTAFTTQEGCLSSMLCPSASATPQQPFRY